MHRWLAGDEDDEHVCVELAEDEVHAWMTCSGSEDERGTSKGTGVLMRPVLDRR
jgi:hypothetical protein